MATADQIQNSFSGYPRTLMWSDFPVRATSPDPPHAAQTVSSFSMSHGSAALGTDGWYRLTNVRVRVTLNTGAMWQARDWFDSASNQEQIDLLEHEQGHFEITGLVARDLCVSLLNLELSDAVAGAMRGIGTSAGAKLTYARTQLAADAREVSRRATTFFQWIENANIGGTVREGQYERDTNHGMNRTAQTRWTEIFRFARTSGTPLSLALLMRGCGASMPIGTCVANSP